MKTFTRIRCTAALVVGCLALVAVAPAQAVLVTATVADGTFPADGTPAPQILNSTTPLPSEFVIENAPLTFTADLTTPVADGGSAYRHGLGVGDVWFSIFPGLDGNGAFRISTDPSMNGDFLTNTNMAFSPENDLATISVVLTDAGGGNYDALVTVTSGLNTFNNGGTPFAIPAAAFGGLTEFGVGRSSSGGNNDNDVLTNYSNVLASVEIPVIPEPGTITLAALGMLGLCFYRRRRIA